MTTVTILTALLIVALIAIAILVAQLRLANKEADEISDAYDVLYNRFITRGDSLAQQRELLAQCGQDAAFWRTHYCVLKGRHES